MSDYLKAGYRLVVLLVLVFAAIRFINGQSRLSDRR